MSSPKFNQFRTDNSRMRKISMGSVIFAAILLIIVSSSFGIAQGQDTHCSSLTKEACLMDASCYYDAENVFIKGEGVSCVSKVECSDVEKGTYSPIHCTALPYCKWVNEECVDKPASETTFFTTVSGNDISMNGDGSIGVNLQETSYESLSNNNFSVAGSDSSSVISNTSFDLNIINNNLTCLGINCTGLSLLYSGNTTANNNQVNSSGEATKGLELVNSTKLTLKENSISTINGTALFVYPSLNKTYYNHTIENNNEGGRPILYYFDKDGLTIYDLKDFGQLYIAFSNGTNVSLAISSLDGITLANVNNTLINSSKLEYTDCNSSGIFLVNSVNTSINDSLIKSACKNTAETAVWNATNASFTNTTYENAYFFDKSSTLSRYWYLDLLVKDKDEDPVVGAEVELFDQNIREVFYLETDEAGKIKRQTLLEYNQTGISGFNPPSRLSLSPYTAWAQNIFNKHAIINSTLIELTESKEVTIHLYDNSDFDLLKEKCNKDSSACSSSQTCILDNSNLPEGLKGKTIAEIIRFIDANTDALKKSYYSDISKLKETIRKGCVPSDIAQMLNSNCDKFQAICPRDEMCYLTETLPECLRGKSSEEIASLANHFLLVGRGHAFFEDDECAYYSELNHKGCLPGSVLPELCVDIEEARCNSISAKESCLKDASCTYRVDYGCTGKAGSECSSRSLIECDKYSHCTLDGGICRDRSASEMAAEIIKAHCESLTEQPSCESPDLKNACFWYDGGCHEQGKLTTKGIISSCSQKCGFQEEGTCGGIKCNRDERCSVIKENTISDDCGCVKDTTCYQENMDVVLTDLSTGKVVADGGSGSRKISLKLSATYSYEGMAQWSSCRNQWERCDVSWLCSESEANEQDGQNPPNCCGKDGCGANIDTRQSYFQSGHNLEFMDEIWCGSHTINYEYAPSETGDKYIYVRCKADSNGAGFIISTKIIKYTIAP